MPADDHVHKSLRTGYRRNATYNMTTFVFGPRADVINA